MKTRLLEYVTLHVVPYAMRPATVPV